MKRGRGRGREEGGSHVHPCQSSITSREKVWQEVKQCLYIYPVTGHERVSGHGRERDKGVKERGETREGERKVEGVRGHGN